MDNNRSSATIPKVWSKPAYATIAGIIALAITVLLTAVSQAALSDKSLPTGLFGSNAGMMQVATFLGVLIHPDVVAVIAAVCVWVALCRRDWSERLLFAAAVALSGSQISLLGAVIAYNAYHVNFPRLSVIAGLCLYGCGVAFLRDRRARVWRALSCAGVAIAILQPMLVTETFRPVWTMQNTVDALAGIPLACAFFAFGVAITNRFNIDVLADRKTT